MTIPTAVKPNHQPAVPLWKNPVAVGIFLVVYVLVIAFILLSLDRRDTWFSLKTTLAFPPLALAPLLMTPPICRMQTHFREHPQRFRRAPGVPSLRDPA